MEKTTNVLMALIGTAVAMVTNLLAAGVSTITLILLLGFGCGGMCILGLVCLLPVLLVMM